jgi:hypothetical protein
MCIATETKISKEVKKIFKDEKLMRKSCPWLDCGEELSLKNPSKIFKDHLYIAYGTLIHADALLPIFIEDKKHLKIAREKISKAIGFISDLITN